MSQVNTAMSDHSFMNQANNQSFNAGSQPLRENLLTKCFNACDKNGDNLLDPSELQIIAKSFHISQSISQTRDDIDQEVKIIMSKLDTNGDGLIGRTEWITVLTDLFRFMNDRAFQTHCEELLSLAGNK